MTLAFSTRLNSKQKTGTRKHNTEPWECRIVYTSTTITGRKYLNETFLQAGRTCRRKHATPICTPDCMCLQQVRLLYGEEASVSCSVFPTRLFLQELVLGSKRLGQLLSRTAPKTRLRDPGTIFAESLRGATTLSLSRS